MIRNYTELIKRQSCARALTCCNEGSKSLVIAATSWLVRRCSLDLVLANQVLEWKRAGACASVKFKIRATQRSQVNCYRPVRYSTCTLIELGMRRVDLHMFTINKDTFVC